MPRSPALKKAQAKFYKKNKTKIHAANILRQKKLRQLGIVAEKKGFTVEDLQNLPSKA